MSPAALEAARTRSREYQRRRRAAAKTDAALAAVIQSGRRACAARRQERIRQLIIEAKQGGCVDCGRADLPHEVLDLDHVLGERKFSLAKASAFGIGAIKDELTKCEVRCPTCHVLRHYHERVNNHGRFH